MINQMSRRDFIRAAIAAGIAVPALGEPLLSAADTPAKKGPNEKLNLAIIGVANKGRHNLDQLTSENIVALCDIDRNFLAQASKDFPSAKTMEDYRAVFDLPNLDGVVISTPDHMHAIPTLAALKRGLAVYCEKPLTHTVREARLVREATVKHKCITQMGTQIHAGNNYRRVVELILQGAIGPVKRVHVWQGNTVPACQRAAATAMPPDHVNYDLWIGPAPMRPFHTSHFHFQWRWWWDFGGGVLADMACHYVDLPFWALGLTAPTSVAAKGEKGHAGDNDVPSRLQVDYKFPARENMPAVDLTWYHGGWQPPGAEEYKLSSAVLFEGSEGRLLADYGSHKLFMQQGKEARPVKQTIPNSVGHWKEWTDAIRAGTPNTTCRFEYGGMLTETALLGNVSYRSGKPIEWKTESMSIPNEKDAEKFLSKEYRQGWELPTA